FGRKREVRGEDAELGWRAVASPHPDDLRSCSIGPCVRSPRRYGGVRHRFWRCIRRFAGFFGTVPWRILLPESGAVGNDIRQQDTCVYPFFLFVGWLFDEFISPVSGRRASQGRSCAH